MHGGGPEACLGRRGHGRRLVNPRRPIEAAGAGRAAEASRQRWRSGRPLGPLDGVPVSLKDNLHAAGQPTTWGSRLLRDFVATRDELPVARLRAGGAVLFGKTNLPEFAMQGYTSNLLAGPSRNPWNQALTPGGSSGKKEKRGRRRPANGPLTGILVFQVNRCPGPGWPRREGSSLERR